MIVLLGSLQKSGSLWLLKMVNDLVLAGGGSEMTEIRQRYRLGWFLRPSGHVSLLRFHRVLHLILPALLGETFVINTHAPPGWSLRQAIRLGWVKPVYIYRDPRDVARSLYEHGQDLRNRNVNSSTTFDNLLTMEAAIHFTAERLREWRRWMQINGVLPVRYEDLLSDPFAELTRVTTFLELDLIPDDIHRAVANHDRSKATKGSMHFNKGVVGRWKEVLTRSHLQLCEDLFGEYLAEMGYAPAMVEER